MKKILEYMEQYSQWIALSLGGLWLLYMVYAHVLASDTSSIVVKGAPGDLGPASVDAYVKEYMESKLVPQLNGHAVIAGPTTDPSQPLKEELALETPVESLPGDWPDSAPMTQKDGLAGGGKPLGGGQVVVVNSLPTLPMLTAFDAVTGKSIVTVPGAAGANGQGAQARQLWATVFGTIPMKDLTTAFKNSNVLALNVQPAEQTEILQVTIQREELLPNGTWGPPLTIVSNATNLDGMGAAAAGGAAGAPPVFPPAMGGNGVGAALQYIQWAKTNQQPICQPNFFVVVRGDNWRLPGQPAINVGAPIKTDVPAPAPATPTPIRPQPGRGGNPPRSGGGPSRGGAGGGGGGGGGPRGSVDPTTLQPPTVILAQMAPGSNGDGRPGENRPGDLFGNSMPPGGMPGGPNSAAAAAAAAANAITNPPTGLFIPAATGPDISLWVHDLTVVGGKTYRYSMKYTMKNPVFTFPNLCPPTSKQWANQFAIESAFTPFGKPVQIPDTTSYFVTGRTPGKEEVKFDVFTWNVGGVIKTPATASPGDTISEELPLTLVDVREINQDTVVTLVDADGTLTTRYLKVDTKDPAYRDLQKEAALSASGTTPGGPGAAGGPGSVPGGGGFPPVGGPNGPANNQP